MALADDLIVRFLSGEADDADLAAGDVDVLHRMFDLWSGQATTRLPGGLPRFRSQIDVERWHQAMRVIGTAHPEAFLDRVEDARARAVPLPAIWVGSVLGRIHDPRAVALLGEYLRDDKWLVRVNVVGDLADHVDDPSARRLVESALDDPSSSVRLRAIKVLSRYDIDRARGLLEAFVQEPDLPPTLAADARASLEQLRR